MRERGWEDGWEYFATREGGGWTWLPNRSCDCLGDAWGDLNGFLRSRWSQESVKHPREYRRRGPGGTPLHGLPSKSGIIILPGRPRTFSLEWEETAETSLVTGGHLSEPVCQLLPCYLLWCKQITTRSQSQVPPGWPLVSVSLTSVRTKTKTSRIPGPEISCNGFLTLKHLLVVEAPASKPDVWRCHQHHLPPSSLPLSFRQFSARQSWSFSGGEDSGPAGYHLLSQWSNNDPLVIACPLTTITKQLDTSCLRPQKSISSPETMSELWGQNTRIKLKTIILSFTFV